MDKMIFICTGNTCRSPMCEAFFRLHDGTARLGLAAESAGLFTADGLPASENAVIAARERGATLEGHTSRRLTAQIAADARYLVCMTSAHYDRLLERYPQYADKIFTLDKTDLGDPFGGDLETYRRSAAQLDEAVERLIERLEERT